jgi:hypothetical protein
MRKERVFFAKRHKKNAKWWLIEAGTLFQVGCFALPVN